MFNQYEIPAYLEDNLPEMKDELARKSVGANLFDPNTSIACLSDFAIGNAQKHNMQMLKRCFQAAEKLLIKGNETVRSAIENVFIKPLAVFCRSCPTSIDRKQIQSIMPTHLYSACIAQVINGKC